MSLMEGQPAGEISVPIGRRGREGAEVMFVVIIVEVFAAAGGSGVIAPVGTGGLFDIIGRVPLLVPLNNGDSDDDGKGRNPDRGPCVAFVMDGRGTRPDAVVFLRGRGGRGKRPDREALKLVVKLTVGMGKRPDREALKWVVEFPVGNNDGMKPDRGQVELDVRFAVGTGQKPEPVGTVG